MSVEVGGGSSMQFLVAGIGAQVLGGLIAGISSAHTDVDGNLSPSGPGLVLGGLLLIFGVFATIIGCIAVGVRIGMEDVDRRSGTPQRHAVGYPASPGYLAATPSGGATAALDVSSYSPGLKRVRTIFLGGDPPAAVRKMAEREGLTAEEMLLVERWLAPGATR